jgi:hypothetical protein
VGAVSPSYKGHRYPVEVISYCLLWRPGELGRARVWVDGDLEVDGDLYELLKAVPRAHAGGVQLGRTDV